MNPMTRTEKLKPGTLVQVVESEADKYDSRTRDYGGYAQLDYAKWGAPKQIWPFKTAGMIVSMNLRYEGDPYPEYCVLVGDRYFERVPTRYIKKISAENE